MTGYICTLLKLAVIILTNVSVHPFAGTASANDISVTSPVQITFLSGDAPNGSPMTRCTADIMIVDDQALEPDETFTVFISSPTECVDSPGFAQVTIQDDDSMYTYFSIDKQNSGFYWLICCMPAPQFRESR